MPFLLILIAGGGFIFVALSRMRRAPRTSTRGISTSIAGARNVAELHELALLAAAGMAGFDEAPLDFTDASIDRLGVLLQYDRTRTERDDALVSESFVKERMLVLGSYVGELLIRNHGGAWNIDSAIHPLPYIEFSPTVRASPFDFVRSEWESGGRSIGELYRALLDEVAEASTPATLLQVPHMGESATPESDVPTNSIP